MLDEPGILKDCTYSCGRTMWSLAPGQWGLVCNGRVQPASSEARWFSLAYRELYYRAGAGQL